MTPIDPSQVLAAAVRAQLAALRERQAVRAERSPASQAARAASQGLSGAMARRVQAIAPDDPDRPGKAVRVYLEAQLAREFGNAVVNDPAFPALLDAVQQGLREDAQTAAAVEALGRLLVSGSVPEA